MSEPRAWPAGRPEVLHHIAKSLNARFAMQLVVNFTPEVWGVIGTLFVALLGLFWRIAWCSSKTYHRVQQIDVLEAAHQKQEQRVGFCEQTIAKHGVRLTHLESKKASA